MIVLRNTYLEKLTALIPELSKQSSQNAWDGFVRMTGDDLHKYICYYLNDHEFASDILQEVYLAFLKDNEGFCQICEKEPEEIASKKVYAWLYKTARNKSLNHLKKKRNASAANSMLLDKAQQMKPDMQKNPLEMKETNDLVKYELSQLNERQQNLITLKFYLEKSNAEIAREIKCELASVQKLVDRALIQLKNRLEKSGVHLSIALISEELISKSMCQNLPPHLLLNAIQLCPTVVTGGILTKTILLKGIIMKAIYTVACVAFIGTLYFNAQPKAGEKPISTQEKPVAPKVALNKSTKNPFAHELENVAPHPDAEFITLDNGFQIVLLPNNIPEKKVILKLCVKSGSQNENENGFSNLLNRMAYAGTKNYSKDYLVTFYKKIFKAYGAESYLPKSLTETNYSFFNIDEALAYEAIDILADYAMNIQITPENIEKVIDEMLKEKNYNYLLENQKNYFSSLPKSLKINRNTMITTENRQSVTTENLLSFYHNQYQPGNMILLVVGDIHKQDLLTKIKSTFGLFKASSDKQHITVLEDIDPKGLEIQYSFNAKQFNTMVALNTLKNKKNTDLPYKEKVKQKIIMFAVTFIFNQQFKLNQTEKYFSSLNFSVFNYLNRYENPHFSLYCEPKYWKQSIIFLENELRNLLQYQVTDHDISNFKKNFIISLDSSVDSMKTKKSYEHMEFLVRCNDKKIPFQDAFQIRQLEEPSANSITKEDVMNAFKNYWSSDYRIISVSSNIEIKDAETEIKNVYEDATKIEK